MEQYCKLTVDVIFSERFLVFAEPNQVAELVLSFFIPRKKSGTIVYVNM